MKKEKMHTLQDTVYAQSTDGRQGSLTATDGDGGAGIGGGVNGADGRKITINGGKVTAIGYYGAGIGGGTVSSGNITEYNGAVLTTNGVKTDNRVFTCYTDITASYLYTDKGNGRVQASTGKVIAGITMSSEKPAGLAGTAKAEYASYTAEVPSKYQSYVTAVPIPGSRNQFMITAAGLKNNKDTKVSITFKCSQNNKKISFPLTITPAGA